MKRKPIDISGYLVKRFGADYRNENWRFDCPICGADRERFSVSVKKGIVHCWKCEYKNGILGFVSEVEGVNLAGAVRIISKYRPVPTEKRPEVLLGRRQVKTKINGYRPLNTVLQQTIQGKMAYAYLRSRGLTKRDIQHYRLGLSSDPEYSGRIIHPFIESGETTYFVARSFAGSGPKYKNPSTEDWGIGKSELLYNADALSRNSSITIVEGVYDVYGVGRNAVALLGKVASTYQISRILMSGVQEVVIMLDSDAKDEAMELAGTFGELIDTKIVLLEKGDPADNKVSPSGKVEVKYSLRELLRSKISKQR